MSNAGSGNKILRLRRTILLPFLEESFETTSYWLLSGVPWQPNPLLLEHREDLAPDFTGRKILRVNVNVTVAIENGANGTR